MKADAALDRTAPGYGGDQPETDIEALEHELPVPHAVADRLRHGVGLLVDLLEHERLVARALGRVIVPVDLDELVARGRHPHRHADHPEGKDPTQADSLER